MKQCTKCKKELELSQFHNCKNTKDKLNSWCKYCMNTLTRSYYQKHRKKLIKESKIRTRKNSAIYRERINNIKSQGCSICSEKDIRCIDFHHKDPQIKEFEISDAINPSTLRKGWITIKNELDKCILVCGNCHRKIHNGLLII